MTILIVLKGLHYELSLKLYSVLAPVFKFRAFAARQSSRAAYTHRVLQR